jgi:hypothetical protein
MLNKSIFKTYRGYAFLSIAFIVLISPFISGINLAISWDTVGYYWYLPQYFIYGGKITSLETVELLRQKYDFCSHIYQFNQEANGLWVTRYTMGQSIFQFPFFIIAHLIAIFFGLKSDGFSNVYLFFQVIGSSFYFLTALYLLKELLIEYVSDKAVAISLLLLFFGTNVFYNYTHQIWYCSTHNYLFVGIVFLIYLFKLYSISPSASLARVIGLVCALIALTRPAASSVLLLLVFPLLLNNNIKWDKYFLNIFLGAIFPLMLQMLFWKSNTGEWVYLGYKNPAEGFATPGKYLIQNLFYFRKGWLVYTPVMVFALFGFYPLYKNNKSIFWTISSYFILNILIISSWTVWWWSESYGHRAMIESYAVLIFPLAFFTEKILKIKARFIFLPIFFMLCVLNIFKVWQYSKGIINPSRMTKRYYLSTFLSTDFNPELDSLLLINRNYNGPEIPRHPWRYIQEEVFKLDSLDLSDKVPYPLGWKDRFSNLTKTDHFFYKTVFRYSSSDTAFKPQFVFYAEHLKIGYKYKGKELYGNTISTNEKVEFYYLSPEVRSDKDSIGFYFFSQGKGRGKVKDMRVYVLKEK